MSVQKIIDRIQKLRQLSTSSNINEATAAAAAANKLIDQYRLSEIDLESTETGYTESVEEDSDFVYETGKITFWKNNLILVLTKHYGCACWNNASYVTGRKVSRYRLVGRRSDIGIVKYMFAWLCMECTKLSEHDAKGKGRVFIASYCEGFVRGIEEQLRLSREEVKKEASQVSIIKIDSRWQEATDEMRRLHNLVRKSSRSNAQRNSEAFSQGHVKGKLLHLGDSMASGETKKLAR